MNKNAAVALSIVFSTGLALGQGRPVDWPSHGGDARRSGWEKSDIRITKENVKDFKLLYKRKFEGPSGPHSLTPPAIVGLLISYKGFKELGFVSGSNGDLWSLDVDINRMFWQTKHDAVKGSGICGSLAATPALTPPAVFGRRPAGAAPAASRQLPPRLGGGGFGGARPVWIVDGQGKMRQVNTADGSDMFPALNFLPAGARTSSVLMSDNTLYALSAGACNGTTDGLYAMDLTQESPKVTSLALPGGAAGFAAGNDGTLYVQTAGGLHLLGGKGLEKKSLLAEVQSAKGMPDLNSTTPIVFDHKGKDYVVSAGKEGNLFLAASDGALHSKTAPLASAKGGVWGGLATWEDGDGTRWVAAPVWGALNPALKVPASNGSAPNGSVVAFKVEEKDGKLTLNPAWTSRDLKSPIAPVVTSGTVFALSTGGKATLFAFDSTTGKEVYSTGNQVTAPGSLTGLTLANGRVYFTTTDNTLYAFGIGFEI